MIKKLTSLLLAAVTIISITSTSILAEDNIVSAQNDITVYVDGAKLEFDQPPVIKDDRALVPLRAIFEALNATVEWEQETQTITAESNGTVIVLQIGSNVLTVGDKSITLETAPVIIGDRTLVPVRAVSESLNAAADWDSENRVVTIVSASAENSDVKSYADYQTVEWTENKIKLSTGINLAYTVTGPENGIPVVLIHGLTDGRVSWSQVAPELAQKGYRVYVPEYRGNGKTDKPYEESAYSVEELTKDIAAFVDELNIEKPHIVGHSLGSFIAQELNISYKDKISSITLIGSGVSVSTDNETIDWLVNGDEEGFNGIYGYDDTQKLPESFIEAWGYSTNPDPDFQAANLAHLRQTPYYVWKNLVSNLLKVDNTDRLEDITGDVQIIWGSEDVIFPEEQQELLKKGLVNSNVTFHEIEGADHNTHWGSKEAVDTVVSYIDEFIKNQY